MSQLVFFVEERSSEEMLRGFVPRIIPEDWSTHFISFEGKQDLLKRLERKIGGWQAPQSSFVILIDKDQRDCHTLKDELIKICSRAARGRRFLIRIACHELENWYLGDLLAVERGFTINGLSKKQDQRKFRNPDALSNAPKELREITRLKYQKVSGSRILGPLLSMNHNRSKSFQVFLTGLREFVEK